MGMRAILWSVVHRGQEPVAPMLRRVSITNAGPVPA